MRNNYITRRLKGEHNHTEDPAYHKQLAETKVMARSTPKHEGGNERATSGNDRQADSWAREEDEEGDVSQPPVDTGGEHSAAEEVERFILEETTLHSRNLEMQLMAGSLPHKAPGEVPTAEDVKREAEKACTHPTIDALRMLSVEERRKGLVKWPIDPDMYPTTCDVCEKVIEVGAQYKRCRLCEMCRCKDCQWTLKHSKHSHR